jgi:hypothetical protein
VDDALDFLRSIPEIKVESNAASRITTFLNSSNLYPFRLKVSYSNYVLFLKTEAEDLEQFKEEEKIIRISAVIYVERDSQKGIIIGHKGFALKKVSTEARKALEKFFGKSIFLETFVKVDKDWRSSKRELDSFGYNPE